MFENIALSIRQFGAVLKDLSAGKKVAVVGVVALVIASFIALLAITGRADYQVLYSGLTPEDAGQVVEKLKEMRVEYKLDAGGTTVMVPRDNLYETRLALAGMGVPSGGGIGMEIFNENKIGATEFVQRINYQRALQGELSRTISQFRQVKSARVHIVTPRDSLFVEEQKPTTAAVVLTLKGSQTLSQSEVQGIVNLVSGAVEGLKPENVTVVDTSGKVLYDRSEEGQATGLTDSQIEYQRAVETGLANKIQALLAGVVGPNKSVAKVSAKIDFNREQLVEEKYDPDGAVVRSSQSTEENSEGQSLRPTGSPDEQFKITAGVNANRGSQSKFNRSSETLNYEINKTNRQVVKSPGEIDRLSVAVLIDGRYQTQTNAQGQPTKTFVPRTDEEIQRLTALIRSAVGYNETRGDVIQVTSMAFEGVPEAVEYKPTIMEQVMTYARAYGQTALGVVLALLFILFVLRPMLRWSGRELKEALVERPKLPTPEELEAAQLEDLRVEKAGPRERAGKMIDQNPDLAMEVIRTWINQGMSEKPGGRV